MEKKVVVITGASSGIGKETANLFLKNCYEVYGIGTRSLSNVQFNYIQADIREFENCETAIKNIILSAGKIDLLVNNAGIGISGPVENTSTEDAKNLFDINFFGAVNMCKAVLPHFRKAGGGKIINVSSVASFVPIPFQIFYSASKASLDTFASGLRSEVKPFNIQITNIHPGDVQTGFTERRKKAMLSETNPYSKNCNSALKHMEHDETNGMLPSKIANTIFKISQKKHTKAVNVVGGSYKLMTFVLKLFPCKTREALVRKFYF